MALTVKALNNDSSFLLIFTPPIAPKDVKSPELFPGAYTILVDPWLNGAAEIFSPKFSTQQHQEPSCVASLSDLPEPDMVLISQHQPDHCHQETLCQLSPHVRSIILAPAAAAKKIRTWQHFDFSCIQTLRRYKEKKEETVFRIEIPPFSPSGSPGEVTISLLEPKRDFYGVHNAIGITYRPPCSVLSLNMRSYVNLPKTPSSPPSQTRPMTPRVVAATANTIYPSPYNNHEKTISVLYSPHGIPYDAVKPWASTHLVSEAALPLAALVHSFVQVDIPWYMGGNMASGCPGGLEIAKNLLPKAWIAAHDEEKKVSGFATHGIRRKEFGVEEVKKKLLGEVYAAHPRLGTHTEIVKLESGKDFRIAAQ
jgi:hypothetical protein